MRIVEVTDYDDLSRAAADILLDQVRGKPDSVICFPTGSTPEGMYALARQACADGDADFSQVRVLSVDEYWPLPEGHEQSYAVILAEAILGPAGIEPANIHLLPSWSPDRDAACAANDRLVAELGIDLIIDGVGENGHLAFNEPAPELTLGTHAELVSDDTRRVNSRFFDSEADVPRFALTLGVDQILGAHHVLVLASGAKKTAAVRRLIDSGTVTTTFPASFLWLHGNATLIADSAALGTR